MKIEDFQCTMHTQRSQYNNDLTPAASWQTVTAHATRLAGHDPIGTFAFLHQR